MGGTISFSLGRSRPGNSRRQKDKLRIEEEERRRQQRRKQRLLDDYGVLIPPVFVANQNNADVPLSVKAHQRMWEEHSFATAADGAPNSNTSGGVGLGSDLLLWACCSARNGGLSSGPLLGDRLLEEYIRPGLFVALPIANASASMVDDNNKIGIQVAVLPPSSSLPSFVFLTKSLHSRLRAEGFLSQPLATAMTTGGSQEENFVGLPWSLRLLADISRDISSSSSHKRNQTRITWTTTPASGVAPPPSAAAFQRMLRNSWIEAEAVRPDWYRSGINFKLATGTTLDALAELGLDASRLVHEAYLERNALEINGGGHFLSDWTNQRRKQQQTRADNSGDHQRHVRFRVAAECRESILAASANIPLRSALAGGNWGSVTNTLLSINLNGGGAGQTRLVSLPPPLWLTLKQSMGCGGLGSSSSWMLHLSQVVAFDRDIWNILEERAPRVRNHIGWVCQVERRRDGTPSAGGKNAETNAAAAYSNSSTFALGASAQFNRNVAAKAVLESTFHDGTLLRTSSSSSSSASSGNHDKNSAVLKFALIFKRWLQPRASLSIVHAVDLRSGRLSFLGLGVEIEQSGTSSSHSAGRTTGQQTASNRGISVEYRDTTDVNAERAPPTRVEVQLPQGGSGDKR